MNTFNRLSDFLCGSFTDGLVLVITTGIFAPVSLSAFDPPALQVAVLRSFSGPCDSSYFLTLGYTAHVWNC